MRQACTTSALLNGYIHWKWLYIQTMQLWEDTTYIADGDWLEEIFVFHLRMGTKLWIAWYMYRHCRMVPHIHGLCSPNNYMFSHDRQNWSYIDGSYKTLNIHSYYKTHVQWSSVSDQDMMCISESDFSNKNMVHLRI